MEIEVSETKNDLKLLDVLFNKGKLPRYAFPTDVATFYVFDRIKSKTYRPEFLYQPSQSLQIALSQYAPGKEVWIDGKKYISGAIYSPYKDERENCWQRRRLYYECEVCSYAETRPLSEGRRNELLDCPACGSIQSFGPSMLWIRPTGFAHPILSEAEHRLSLIHYHYHCAHSQAGNVPERMSGSVCYWATTEELLILVAAMLR